MVVALTVVVGGVLMSSIRFMYRTNSEVFSELSAVGEARRALAQMLEEIRQASYGVDGAYPLMEAEANRLVLHADADHDGIVERIEYSAQDAVLTRRVVLPEGLHVYGEIPVLEQVITNRLATSTTALFTYVGQGGVAYDDGASLGLVRIIHVTLPIASDDARSPEPVMLEGSASLRNVRN